MACHKHPSHTYQFGDFRCNKSKYADELPGFSKSTFMPGLPLKGNDIIQHPAQFMYHAIILSSLVVSMLAIGHQVHGFKPT
jgi:hypothetical protein